MVYVIRKERIMYLVVFENFESFCSPYMTEGIYKAWQDGYVDVYKHINNQYFVLSIKKKGDEDYPFTEESYWVKVKTEIDKDDKEIIPETPSED